MVGKQRHVQHCTQLGEDSDIQHTELAATAASLHATSITNTCCCCCLLLLLLHCRASCMTA
jgi:hypothetical protein